MGRGTGEQADLCLLLETVRRRSEMSHWLFGLIYDRIKCLVKAQTMHVKREALKELLITPQCLRCVCLFTCVCVRVCAFVCARALGRRRCLHQVVVMEEVVVSAMLVVAWDGLWSRAGFSGGRADHRRPHGSTARPPPPPPNTAASSRRRRRRPMSSLPPLPLGGGGGLVTTGCAGSLLGSLVSHPRWHYIRVARNGWGRAPWPAVPNAHIYLQNNVENKLIPVGM